MYLYKNKIFFNYQFFSSSQTEVPVFSGLGRAVASNPTTTHAVFFSLAFIHMPIKPRDVRVDVSWGNAGPSQPPLWGLSFFLLFLYVEKFICFLSASVKKKKKSFYLALLISLNMLPILPEMRYRNTNTEILASFISF